MEKKRAYAKRVTFTEPQQQIILDNYQQALITNPPKTE